MQDAKPVRLSVPAEPAYARSVRMLAANLAVLAGMSVEDVEDVRMAAEEGFVWSCATKPETCDVTLYAADGLVSIEFSLGAAELDEDDQASAYAGLILAAVCDDFDCDRAAGVLRLRKGTDAPDA
ncbi:ATP-binding protein [uncultured Parolsenella sp.]|uniref:ATP-binding protein n=1 Tax=uncultured Parolsenella sp. TaxID=2083008 RepID=UPI0027D95D83|nr:ATP-binding protein [uncultured Parolsenella sp.]